MTRYDDVRLAYADIEPKMRATDQLFRELPERMRQAIKHDLQAPDGGNCFLTAMYDSPIGYVYVARPQFDALGNRKWVPVRDGELLYKNERARFCFGIAIVLQEKGQQNPDILTMPFSIEDVTDDLVVLGIENVTERIDIDLHSTDGYSKAAATAINLLIKSLKNFDKPLQSPIGFGRY